MAASFCVTSDCTIAILHSCVYNPVPSPRVQIIMMERPFLATPPPAWQARIDSPEESAAASGGAQGLRRECQPTLRGSS
eukprot:scaffold1899_cov372-Prasinococcus_capsulatus_cf.AAC.6